MYILPTSIYKWMNHSESALSIYKQKIGAKIDSPFNYIKGVILLRSRISQIRQTVYTIKYFQ